MKVKIFIIILIASVFFAAIFNNAYLILVPFILYFLIFFIFIIFHFRTLTENEVIQLSKKRRDKKLSEYFIFDNREYSANKSFKKNMNPNGKIYQINETLFEFPSIAAALLKYKKHEWIIIAFEKNKNINFIWLNKGLNRASVSSYIDISTICNFCKEYNQTSILIFHNHPNVNHNYYDVSTPSDNDIESAKYFAQALNINEINLLEFICERGSHNKYYFSITDSFLPLSGFISTINENNGKSKIKNLLLHYERVFR